MGTDDNTPPALALLQQALGFWISRAICVVARLGIADLLKDGALDTETMATAAGVHAPSLYRVLRTLASVGIFAEGEDGRFGLTPQAGPLRNDAPDSIRDYILLVGEEWYSGPSEHLLHSVQTGRPAFERVHGADFFTFLAREPAATAVFDAAMTSRSVQENDAIAAVCDFSGLRTIIDVGGGYGSLLAAILRANPGLRGVLFDRPQPVAEARHRLGAAGLGVRCEVVAGDFFVSVPAGGDAYILKRVIHDWGRRARPGDPPELPPGDARTRPPARDRTCPPAGQRSFPRQDLRPAHARGLGRPRAHRSRLPDAAVQRRLRADGGHPYAVARQRGRRSAPIAWLRIYRVLRVMLHTRWSAEAGSSPGSSSGGHSRCQARSGARGGSTSHRAAAASGRVRARSTIGWCWRSRYRSAGFFFRC